MGAHRTKRLALAVVLAAGAVGLASAQPATDLQAPPPEPVPAEAVTPPEPAPAPTTPAAAPAPEAAPDSSRPSDKDDLPSSASAAAKPTVRRTLYTAAVIQVLDKVTAENLRFEAPLHKFIRYKGLIFLVNTCQSGTPDQPTPAAHIEIDSQPPHLPNRPENPVKLVFRGWMYADTPGPHPFEHPVYDAWLIACKTASGGA